MKKMIAAFSVVAFLAAGLVAEEKKALVSGPQVGEKLAGPFHPLNINGSEAGKKNCLYCSNGTNPVAMVFAREVTPELTKLIKKIDETTVKNADANMGSFVVFCTADDEKDMVKKLEKVATDNKLKKCVLSIDNPAGPKGYKVAKDADITVVLYVNHTAKANYTFKKGQFSENDIPKIIGDVSKIVTK